jgi:hypothetical protein
MERVAKGENSESAHAKGERMWHHKNDHNIINVNTESLRRDNLIREKQNK